MKAELLFKQGDADPAFVIAYIRPGVPVELIVPGNYIFAYNPSNMLCIGNQQFSILGNYAVAAHTGAAMPPNTPFKVGLYDAASDKFYQLNGTVLNYVNKQPATMKWQSLAVYALMDAVLRNEIVLESDETISSATIDILLKSTTWNNDDPVKIPIKCNIKNINDYTVTSNGHGVLSFVGYNGRWANNFGFYSYDYEISNIDTSVTFTATAHDIFTNAVVTNTAILTVNYVQPEPDPIIEDQEDIILYTEDRFTVVMKTELVNEVYIRKAYLASNLTMQLQCIYVDNDNNTVLASVKKNFGLDLSNCKSLSLFRMWVEETMEYLPRTLIYQFGSV